MFGLILWSHRIGVILFWFCATGSHDNCRHTALGEGGISAQITVLTSSRLEHQMYIFVEPHGHVPKYVCVCLLQQPAAGC